MRQEIACAPSLPDCTGALIAGGQASRLGGVPKGLLRRDGEPILSRSLRVFSGLFAATVVVANDGAPYAALGAAVVPDLIAGRGAPSGLHAALAAARTEWIFTAASDMPFLAPAPIAWLATRRAGAPAVAVVWRGRVEALHAFWRRDCLPAVERMLREGRPSLWAIATAVGARLVPEREWREVDPEGRAFANVNTLEEAVQVGVEVPGSGDGRAPPRT